MIELSTRTEMTNKHTGNPGMMVDDHDSDRDGDEHEDDHTNDHKNCVANLIINDQRSDDQNQMVAKNCGDCSSSGMLRKERLMGVNTSQQ